MSTVAPRAHESDEEAMILDMVRELVAEKVAPRAAEIDESGEFPYDIKELFAQNDLMGIPIPTEYGGLGGTFLTYVKVVEEIAKACASSSLIVAVQELGMLPILIGGSEEQKKRFLPDIAAGKKDCRIRAHGSVERFRCPRFDAHARRTQGRQLRSQRPKDLDHERQRRRRRLRFRSNRS